MSKLQVDDIVNQTDTGSTGFSRGVVVTGVATAAKFSGNLSGDVNAGIVTAASFVGDGSGLINVSTSAITGINIEDSDSVIGVAGTVNFGTNLDVSPASAGIVTVTISGDVSVDTVTADTVTADTVTVENVGVQTITATESRLITGSEKTIRVDGNTVNLNYNNSSGSNIGIATNPDGDVTLNVLNIPTDSAFDDHSITFVVVVNSTGTARTCTAVTLNGVSKTIQWAGGSLEEAITGVTTITGYSFYNFTGINTVGSASTTENYEVFGIVSGGFY